MNILFHLGHPAHYHLFKNVIDYLKNNGDEVYILIKKKDVLEELLISSKIDYYNILPEGRKNSKVGIAIGQIKQDAAVFKFVIRNKIDLLLGTSVSITHVGKLLKIPSIVFNEDDADVVPLFSYLSYPFASLIVSPQCCNNHQWNKKTLFYNSYHELAYLHPNNFIPNKDILTKYIKNKQQYFILRFSSLNAHHDSGVSGIGNKLASEIISILKPHGQIIINSEREIESDLEQYRMNINPIDMHHLLAFAKIYIGDSQTMAAEAGILGTPFLRYNDFVGKIGYLNELEKDFELGYGFKTNQANQLKNRLNELLYRNNLEKEWALRRQLMLETKHDFSNFIFTLVEYIKG